MRGFPFFSFIYFLFFKLQVFVVLSVCSVPLPFLCFVELRLFLILSAFNSFLQSIFSSLVLFAYICIPIAFFHCIHLVCSLLYYFLFFVNNILFYIFAFHSFSLSNSYSFPFNKRSNSFHFPIFHCLRFVYLILYHYIPVYLSLDDNGSLSNNLVIVLLLLLLLWLAKHA